MDPNSYVVIMAGGIGSRFWPYSRNNMPKQFLDILGTGRSLIQLTFDRFACFIPKENIYIVTNRDYQALVEEHLPDITKNQILAEPLRRNTAPCIAYASYKIKNINPDAVIVVAPSDHFILNEEAFKNTINVAIESAGNQDKLLTIGLKPNRPETGFGYIQYIESDDDIKKVKTFTEKPEKELAQKFLDSGDFVWNSGIFVWGVEAITRALETCLPEMADVFLESVNKLNTSEEEEAVGRIYSHCNNISIDYGVMEKASNVFVVLGDFGWSDLGSWQAMHEMSEKDEFNNAIRANALLIESKNNLIKGPKDKLIVVQGLEDYLVAECGNVLLVCKKSDEQKFRDYILEVKEKKGRQFL